MSYADPVEMAVQAELNPHYTFAVHGQSSFPVWGRRLAEPQPQRENQTPYSVTDPAEFSWDNFSDHENLHKIYTILKEKGGPAPGPDGISYSDLSVCEEWDLARWLKDCLRDGTYRPGPTRRIEIPRQGRAPRILNVSNLQDRVVASALWLCFKPYWTQQLPRFGLPVFSVLANMQRTIRERNAFVLAIDDVRDCFPSAPIARVIECQSEHIQGRHVRQLVERIIRGHDGPEEPTGLAQGSPYSPVAMELLLHNCLDQRLDANGPGNPFEFRYVDNLVFICRNESEGARVLERCNDLLSGLNMNLKGQDGPPRDIRDPEFECPILGLITGWNDDRMTFRIPESAFEKLEDGIAVACLRTNPVTVTKAVIKGWLRSGVAPALTNEESPGILERVVRLAHSLGVTEICGCDFSDTVREAQQAWSDLSR